MTTSKQSCRLALVAAECEENLAARYIMASLRAAGHDVVLIPLNCADDVDHAAEVVLRSGAVCVGLSMVFTCRAAEFAELAARCRELGYAAHIVAGGHFAAFHAHALLRDRRAIDSTLEDFMGNVAFMRQYPRNPLNFCRTEVYAGVGASGVRAGTGAGIGRG